MSSAFLLFLNLFFRLLIAFWFKNKNGFWLKEIVKEKKNFNSEKCIFFLPIFKSLHIFRWFWLLTVTLKSRIMMLKAKWKLSILPRIASIFLHAAFKFSHYNHKIKSKFPQRIVKILSPIPPTHIKKSTKKSKFRTIGQIALNNQAIKKIYDFKIVTKSAKTIKKKYELKCW
jgi:hypothetical protein